MSSVLVLDLDNTLITSLIWDKQLECPSGETYWDGPQPDWLINYIYKSQSYTEAIFKRPGVCEFIEYCYKKFKTIGIWTASLEIRAKSILNVLIPKHIRFAFLCARTSESNCIKCSNNLWDLGINPSKTIIIDDIVDIDAIKEGAIVLHIDSYKMPDIYDRKLLNLTKILKSIIINLSIKV